MELFFNGDYISLELPQHGRNSIIVLNNLRLCSKQSDALIVKFFCSVEFDTVILPFHHNDSSLLLICNSVLIPYSWS